MFGVRFMTVRCIWTTVFFVAIKKERMLVYPPKKELAQDVGTRESTALVLDAIVAAPRKKINTECEAKLRTRFLFVSTIN